MNDIAWSALGAIPPAGLVEARLVAHHAAQLAAAPGAGWLARREDWSHESLGWEAAHQALAGREVDGARAALRIGDLTLQVLAGDAVEASLALPGRTRAEAERWLAERFGREEVTLPPHELPDHPVAAGRPFPAVARDALAEVARWFDLADAALRSFAAGRADASPVRCWPHHFDLATLVTLAGSGEAARTVGLGLSPGDGPIPQPYFYVTPWPYPDAAQLPDLPLGRWNTEGWVGAVLDADAVFATGDPQEGVQRFLRGAFAAAAGLLAPGP